MKKKKNKKSFTMNFKIVLLLFAIIPLTVGGLASSIYLAESAKNELEDATRSAMLSVVKETGVAFDDYIINSEDTVKGFAKSPIVVDYLKNPDNADLAAKAQKYTEDFYGSLDGWEGIYIADWNSKVLTHPAPPVVGKVMREGDRLEELRNAMLSSGGIYNTGIITSPASGELIVSMYVPVYDENNAPVGYVGAGTFVSGVATRLTDVSSLGLSSAYTYFVDGQGVMIHHPDESKIGNPVENAAVKGVVGELEAGNHPEPTCVEYLYKGANKYAAYYVGMNEYYVAVLTADGAEVTKNSNRLTVNAIVIDILIMGIFIGVALFVARLITKPLSKVTDVMKGIAGGDLDVDTNIHSILDETLVLIATAGLLKEKLGEIIGDAKNIAGELVEEAENVNELANKCYEGSTQISNAAEELAIGATTMATSVQSIDEQAIVMGDNIDNITESTAALVSLSNEIKSANSDASEYINKVSKSSQQSVNAVNDIANQIGETNKAVISVQEAVDMIQAIASQTSLLALNASIEAARAGEAGRGFAVVATEIGNLSTQSNASASQISDIVKNIVTQSEKSVQLSNEVVGIIKDEQVYIEDTQVKFDVLNQKIEGSLKEISDISNKLDTLAIAKDNIISSVSDLSAISEENAASTEEVSASVTSIAEDLNVINKNSGETKSRSNELSEAVSYFK